MIDNRIATAPPPPAGLRDEAGHLPTTRSTLMLDVLDYIYHHHNGLPQGIALCVISYLTLTRWRPFPLDRP